MLEHLKRLIGLEKAKPATSGPAYTPEAPFEHRVVHGNKVADELAALRRSNAGVPILMGDRHAFQHSIDLIALNDGDTESIAAAGVQLDVERWLHERVEADPDYYEVDESFSGAPRSTRMFSAAHDSVTGRVKEEVYLGLIPVSEPWLVPAYLKTGGWNDCPRAHVHVAFFRRWHERYGATVTTITDDMIEMNVLHPPASREAARALATEHFIYCADIVHQGVLTLGNLGALLQNNDRWFFWWD